MPSMANKKVSLLQRCTVAVLAPGDEYKRDIRFGFHPVVFLKSGDPNPDFVYVRDPETDKMVGHRVQKAGTFYLSWLEGRRIVRKAVGSSPFLAMMEMKRKEAELIAVAGGHKLILPTESDTITVSIQPTCQRSRPPRSRRRSPRTH